VAFTAAIVLVAAGCGGAAKTTAPTTTTTSTTQSPPAVSASACKLTAVTRPQLAKAQRDLAALRRLAKKQTGYTELGTTAMQNATGRYLDDLTTSKLDNFRVNRLIDLGVSAAGPYCGQCFQMLEANRPIPTMKYDGTHC
jgi:hypothetical protein